MLHLKESIIYSSNVCIAVISPVAFFEQIFNYMLGQTPFFLTLHVGQKFFMATYYCKSFFSSFIGGIARCLIYKYPVYSKMV
jgi:hypothetical protein